MYNLLSDGVSPPSQNRAATAETSVNNIQSHSFKMLQKALDEGNSAEDIHLSNLHNVQAPKFYDKNQGLTCIFCPFLFVCFVLCLSELDLNFTHCRCQNESSSYDKFLIYNTKVYYFY